MYALWKYDLFPFVLGGEITKIHSEGKVEVKGYAGFVFSPFKILSSRRGKEVLKKLDELKTKRNKELNSFNKAWNQQIKAVYE